MRQISITKVGAATVVVLYDLANNGSPIEKSKSVIAFNRKANVWTTVEGVIHISDGMHKIHFGFPELKSDLGAASAFDYPGKAAENHLFTGEYDPIEE